MSTNGRVSPTWRHGIHSKNILHHIAHMTYRLIYIWVYFLCMLPWLATLTKLPHKISSSHFLNESETSRCCWLIHNFFCLLSFLSVEHTIIEHTNDHNDKLLSNSLSLSASQPLVEYSSRRGRRQRRTNEGWPFTTNVYHFLVNQWTRLPDLRSVAMFGTLIEWDGLFNIQVVPAPTESLGLQASYNYCCNYYYYYYYYHYYKVSNFIVLLFSSHVSTRTSGTM